MPKLLLYLCILTLSLGQFSSISKGGGVSLYFFDASIACFVVYGLFYLLVHKKSFVIPLFSTPFILFTLSALFSNILNLPKFAGEEVLTASFYLIRWVLYLMLGIVIFNLIKEKVITEKILEDLLLISSCFLVIAGIVQLVLIPDFEQANLTAFGWDPHKNRLASTFLDPNFLGAYLNISIFLLLWRHIKKGLKVFEYVLLAFIFIGVILTFSRSAWLMLGVGVLLFGILKRPWWVVIGVVLAFLAYFAVPRVQTRISGVTDPSDSAQFRLISWENALDVFLDNPVIGVGYNTYRYVQKEYGYLTPDTVESHSGAGADSSLLYLLATTGIVGGLFFSLGLYFLTRNNNSLFYFALIISLVFESTFINSIFYPQILFWIINFGFIYHASRT
jgi:O-antigen ligase